MILIEVCDDYDPECDGYETPDAAALCRAAMSAPYPPTGGCNRQPLRARESSAHPKGNTMNEDEGWGWLTFASIVLVVAGVMRFFDGLYAIRVDAQVPDLDDQLLGEELSAYGWLYLVVGLILIASGFAVYQRSQFARWIGIVAGAILTISATMWLPFAPVWALVYIFIGIFLIYGLAVYGRRVEQPQ